MQKSSLQESRSGSLVSCLDSSAEELEITPMHSRSSTRISRVQVGDNWWMPEEGEFRGAQKPTFTKGDFVAKKLVRTSEKKKSLDVCRWEFDMLKNLRCPHIVAVFDVCLDYKESSPSSFPYFLMELGECSLHFVFTTRLANSDDFLFPSGDGGYSYGHCLSYLMQVAKGMDYLHSKDILHRDLKSMNVLLFNDRTQCRLCDFDVSRELNTCGMTGERGTWRWMAPELRLPPHQRRAAESKLVRYDTKADSYSFGVLVCEALFRNKPFEGYEDSVFSRDDDSIPEMPKVEDLPRQIVKEDSVFSRDDDSIPKVPKVEDLPMQIVKEDRGIRVAVRRDKAVFENVEERLWNLLNNLLNWSEPKKRPDFKRVISVFQTLGAKELPSELKAPSNGKQQETDTGRLAASIVRSISREHASSVVYAVETGVATLDEQARARLKDVLAIYTGNIHVKVADNDANLEAQLKVVKVAFNLKSDALQNTLLQLYLEGREDQVEKMKRHCQTAEHRKWMAELFDYDPNRSLRSVNFALPE